MDYTANAEQSQRFFATVQNKMHWAAHGHTAAEVIHADHIDPALTAIGWGVLEGSRILREYPITLGRLDGQGRRARFDDSGSAPLPGIIGKIPAGSQFSPPPDE